MTIHQRRAALPDCDRCRNTREVVHLAVEPSDETHPLESVGGRITGWVAVPCEACCEA